MDDKSLLEKVESIGKNSFILADWDDQGLDLEIRIPFAHKENGEPRDGIGGRTRILFKGLTKEILEEKIKLIKMSLTLCAARALNG